jgi:site-specific DNA recombinase
MKVIGYARVSTTRQDLARQRVKIQTYCKDKKFNLIKVIEDFGISGAINDRAGYKEIQNLTSEDCDLLIVSELSRLSREEYITETLNNIQNIIRSGISVILLDDANKVYEANKPFPISDTIILTIKLYGAAQERLEIKKKNQDGKHALFLKNPYAVVDSHIPYGYTKVNNPTGNKPKYILQENPEEVAVIKKMFELVLSGKTLFGVAQYFNERDITFRGTYSTVPILSKYFHNDLYRGIRRRIRKYDFVKPEVVESKITPIINETDFLKAQELISSNYKSVSTGKVHFNPFKGIIKCRCGRAMTIKDKKPSKGVSKLTYRCSGVENRSHPNFCSVDIDEVSYDFTNTVIEHLFKQRMNEIQSFYNDTSDIKINDCKEIIAGSEKKIASLKERNEQIGIEIKKTIAKYTITTNETILNGLQDYITMLETEKKNNDKQQVELERVISQQGNKIDEIQKVNGMDVWQRINTLSIEELSTIYHIFLDSIYYYPITLMKGFYKVVYKGGNSVIIAVNKVRSTASAYLLSDNMKANLETGDIEITFAQFKKSDKPNKFVIPASNTITLSLQEFFKSDKYSAIRLELDLDYRNKFLDELNSKGLESHRLQKKD